MLPGPKVACDVDAGLGDAELFLSHFLFDRLEGIGDLWSDVAGLALGRGFVLEAQLVPVLSYLLSSKHLDMPGRWHDVEMVLRKLRADGSLLRAA